MQFVPAKSILSPYTQENRWFACNYNMNLYRGCNHGCIYCDSRSNCYHVEDFDQVRSKQNALEILERELSTKKKKGVIGLGAMSDSYNPFEKKYQITRQALQLIDKYGFGVAIATKSNLITRDIDIFQRIQKHSPVLLKISITTADDQLSQTIEKHVVPSSKRFQAIQQLNQAGIFAGILMMPILPFIEDTDENILTIVELAHQNQTKFIYAGFGVTLRENQRTHFFKKLSQDFPHLREKYIQTYGNQYSCISPRAEHLYSLFNAKCKQHNIPYRMKEIIQAYTSPYKKEQLSFL